LHFGRFRDAQRHEQEALANSVFAENHIARGNLAWAYYGQGDLVRAEVELRQALLRQPEFCVGYYRLAEVLAKRGDAEAALEVLTEIERRMKTCPIQEAFLLLGRVAVARSEPRRALEAFKSCSLLAPRSCVASDCNRMAAAIPEPPSAPGPGTEEASAEEG
jgi:tetratricopeptide (TPR) repeat protein